MTDAELQASIDKAYLVFEGEARALRGLKPGPARQAAAKKTAAAWDVVEDLIKQRSPLAVRRMERQQGLYSGS